MRTSGWRASIAVTLLQLFAYKLETALPSEANQQCVTKSAKLLGKESVIAEQLVLRQRNRRLWLKIAEKPVYCSSETRVRRLRRTEALKQLQLLMHESLDLFRQQLRDGCFRFSWRRRRRS